MERKLATIRVIDNILEIPGADNIEVAVVGGWKCVVKKGAHKKGDKIVYVEIDSWVPHSLAPFLSKGREPRVYDGVLGERLKTIRLKGQISQGLVLSLEDCNIYKESETTWKITVWDGSGNIYYLTPEHEGDLSHYLGIKKWEPPFHTSLVGIQKGNFPASGRKTDQERCQNLVKHIQQAIENGEFFEVSVKLDGSSMSVLHTQDGEIHVCSRNLSLKVDQEGNAFVDTAKRYDLLEKMKSFKNLQISGELCGERIQKNPSNLKGVDFFVFDIYDMSSGKFLPPDIRRGIVGEMGLKHVPVLYEKVTLRELGLDSVDKILEFAEGEGLNSTAREGVVFKSWQRDFSFKAISNKYLEKE